jgi:hypothetical protein
LKIAQLQLENANLERELEKTEGPTPAYNEEVNTTMMMIDRPGLIDLTSACRINCHHHWDMVDGECVE